MSPRESAYEKRLRKQKSIEADKHIQFIPVDEIPQFVGQPNEQVGIRLVFFGANWCKYTQKFTPKYLDAVNSLKSLGYSSDKKPWFDMRKVECSPHKNEEKCVVNYQTEGYPTILIFENGIKREEYPGEDETDPFVSYLKALVDNYETRYNVSKVPRIEKVKSIQLAKPDNANTLTLSKTVDNSQMDSKVSFMTFIIVAVCILGILFWRVKRNAHRYNKLSHH